jgi:hypothetical protein
MRPAASAAVAFSRSVIPGRRAPATISFRVRKRFRPLESQGLITSVAPTFSIRTARLDSQLCSHTAKPPPMGERQFVPSIVPPCRTRYSCFAAVISSVCRLAAFFGWRLDAQGSRASCADTLARLSRPWLLSQSMQRSVHVEQG